MNKLTVLMVLAVTLTACDRAERAERRAEQDSRAYRAAMGDYQAGRMDAAIAGFARAVREDPANASARFQLACLMQDVKKDFAAAYCGYFEYLQLRPGSDKAALAKDRQALCEKELARELASKYGLNAAATAAEELARVRRELKLSESRVAAAERNLGDALARVRALSAERERLLTVVKGFDGGGDERAAAPSAVEAKDLLEESDDELAAHVPTDEARRLLAESDAEAGVSPLLPARSAGGATPPPKAAPVMPAAAAPSHPSNYVVEEGDTLYGISKRFYGTATAWKRIREANKPVISADNRLKAGVTLVLP